VVELRLAGSQVTASPASQQIIIVIMKLSIHADINRCESSGWR